MSTAALLWVHDEPDVLFPNIRYLLTQVDEIMIRDRDSAPALIEEILSFQREHPEVYFRNDGSGDRYEQSRIMTDMALEAMERGHEWVIPIDPDEVWYANGRPLSEALGGMSKDVSIVKAELYNHVASAQDPKKGTPFQKIGFRQRFPLALPKVAARTRPDLVIDHGNHSASTRGTAFTIGPSLVVRHFPYRTEDQFVERVRSAWEQLKVSRLPESFGVHVRAYGKCLDEEGEDALREHFRHWFYSSEPGKDDSLMFDPAPI